MHAKASIEGPEINQSLSPKMMSNMLFFTFFLHSFIPCFMLCNVISFGTFTQRPGLLLLLLRVLVDGKPVRKRICHTNTLRLANINCKIYFVFCVFGVYVRVYIKIEVTNLSIKLLRRDVCKFASLLIYCCVVVSLSVNSKKISNNTDTQTNKSGLSCMPIKMHTATYSFEDTVLSKSLRTSQKRCICVPILPCREGAVYRVMQFFDWLCGF